MSKTAGKGRQDVEVESRKRGIAATGAAVVTGVTATVGLVPLTVVGAGATGVLAYRWWKHRSENGIKF